MMETVSVFKEKIAYLGDKERERILKAAERALEIQKARGLSPSDPPVACLLDCAIILTELEMDADTIIAALFKDTLRADTPADTAKQPALTATLPDVFTVTASAIEEEFGKNAAVLTSGISRIADFKPATKTIQEAENIRKMLFALVSDIRVILIKLAEKLVRMRNLEFLPALERKAEAQECLDIYAPLAGKLGISWIKDELEDLSLKNLNREAFQQIKDIVALKKGEREQFLETVKDRISKVAAGDNLHIEVTTRAKHFYSIYQKMRKRNKSAVDLFDLFGIRIICDSIENCYDLLGLVHRLWKPLDGRFKDYISMHKPNGYQSLHTTVMAFSDTDENRTEDAQGHLLEIQIRTREMHHVAENGIASHWLYKKGMSKEIVRPVDISIVNKLKDWKQRESESGAETSADSFLDEIKKELLKDSIYVFTPQGKVIELPMGATPIDFAYAIHSAIGDHCAGAKADGSIIPFSMELQNTQVVEILTSPNAHPHVNWLRLVKTAKARNKIRSWLQQNDVNLIIGKNIVARKKTREAAAEAPPPEKEQTPQLVIQSGVRDTDILHVRVEDEKDMMIRFAKCCRPVTGDAIIGYISRGRGIIVHKENCKNLLNIPDFPERKIETQWENADSVLVKRFQIMARSAVNLFSEIEGAIHKQQGHLLEGRLEETSSNRLTGYFTIQLDNGKELKQVLKNLWGIPVVLSIKSLGP
ncbi:MAG: HD domain-containing protein [Treponema sp.]|jgi:GTP pyrophosphokinase|nr:HD domain-containing protein [Treponema sp.]